MVAPHGGNVYVDIKVGDILATIRKSVDDDMDLLALPSTASQSRGTLMRGVLREMRVTMNAEPSSAPSVREEIETLRDRIKRNGEATSLLGASQPAAPERTMPPALIEQKAAKATGHFSGILSGRAPAVARPHVAPVLRPTLEEDDHFSGDYHEHEQPLKSRAWVEEEPADIDEYEEQAYVPEPQHYHDRAGQSYAVVAQQPILSAQAEAATETAFRHLSEALLARATGDRGLEDMTREMLRGMIKQWLDANLPTLVEELVREEIERVARRGR